MGGRQRSLGKYISFGIVAGAVILGVAVVRRAVRHPQTDDAVVTADVIGVVPQVSGTITELHVKDNQRVKRGYLLLVIDPRPYEFAVQRARADVAALDGEIAVTERRIEGQRFAFPPPKRRCSARRRSSKTPPTPSTGSSPCYPGSS